MRRDKVKGVGYMAPQPTIIELYSSLVTPLLKEWWINPGRAKQKIQESRYNSQGSNTCILSLVYCILSLFLLNPVLPSYGVFRVEDTLPNEKS
jgi:hypothetical protein